MASLMIYQRASCKLYNTVSRLQLNQDTWRLYTLAYETHDIVIYNIRHFLLALTKLHEWSSMERKKREKGRQTERVIDIANHKDTPCFLDLSKTAIHRVFAYASFSFKQNISNAMRVL